MNGCLRGHIRRRLSGSNLFEFNRLRAELELYSSGSLPLISEVRAELKLFSIRHLPLISEVEIVTIIETEYGGQ